MGYAKLEPVDGDTDNRDARVRALYYVMRSLENKLGGGEGIEGLYGTLACSGMQKVLECMSAKCGMTSDSRLVDMGAGIGRPLLHAVVGGYAARAWGVEIDRVKCDKGNAFMRYAAADLAKRNAAWGAFDVPAIRCAPIEDVRSLDTWTHAYSFWEGVPVDSRRAFAKLFCASKTLQAIAVGQRAMRGKHPQAFMEELGFGPLDLVDSFSVSMAGSGRSFTAYVFNKRGFVPPAVHQLAAASEEACLEALRPPTPCGAREAHPDIISSQESAELDTEDALAWASDIRAQELRAPGVRTRIRSGALPPTAGRVVPADDSAAQRPAVQISAGKAGGTRLSTTMYSVSASAVIVEVADEGPVAASKHSASTKAVSAGAAEAASGSSGIEAAPAEHSRAGARGQGKSAVSTLLGGKAKMSRFGRLLSGSSLATAASSAPQKQLSSLGKEAEDASLPACAPDEPLPVDLGAAQGAGEAPVESAADAAALVSHSAVRAEEDKAESGGRGRKRPSPKKAPGPLGFRARRVPRSELFSKDAHAAAKTEVVAAMDQPRGLGQRRAVEGS